VRSSKPILLIALLAITILLAACNPLSEVRDNHYKDYQSLAAAGETERGWAPELLPESAENIHLKYNLEDNTVLMAFDFAATDAESLARACQPATSAPPPRLSADWWPAEMQSASLSECQDGYLALQGDRAYYWGGAKSPPDAIPVASLYLHPDKYLDLDGQRVTVVGYVDFSNIHDLREMYYSQEGIGFVRKPGQTADAVFFIYFDPADDPHLLFDKLYALQPTHEETGLLLMATGVLHAYDQPTNFSTRTGYVMDMSSPEDVVILR
jgi:hypothetical protein